jgi:hypothetical protein
MGTRDTPIKPLDEGPGKATDVMEVWFPGCHSGMFFI